MRSTSRFTRAIGALIALAASTAACSSTPGGAAASTSSSAEPTTTPTTTAPGPLTDQTPPSSTFGLAYHADQLWVADFYRGQVLAVDPDSGAIIKRLDSQDGVYADVNDVAVGKDGTIFWLGYNDGAVAVLANNEYKTFANVTPGTYSIALSVDGKQLYAGGAVGRPNSVWTLDLTRQDHPTPSGTTTVLRSFDVGQDGRLYGPRFGSAGAGPETSGALVSVDPVSGETATLVSGLDGPIAVKLSLDGGTAHVLCLPPGGRPSLSSFDLATGQRQRPPVELRTPLADNLAVAEDGRIFISSYNDSLVNVVSSDGRVKTLHIGQRPRP